MDLINCVKTVLKLDFALHDEQFLNKDDVEELLRDDDNILEEHVRKDIIGYPTRPLYREVGERLSQWLSSGFCPVENLPCYDLLDETDYTNQRKELFKEISPKLQRIKSLYSVWSEDELLYSVKEILVMLGKRGLLDLLGLRKTVGTSDVWPPPRKTLESIFCQKHSHETGSCLTVGARALAKHCHRDHSSSWWGVSTGSEAAKNEHAFKKVSEILNNATWINMHHLPHDVLTIEARQENGYGARWTSDGQQFRGFLEPQMINGHEIGWKH